MGRRQVTRAVVAVEHGTILAVGAYYNDGASDAGHCRVYQFASGSWTQISSDLDGKAANATNLGLLSP